MQLSTGKNLEKAKKMLIAWRYVHNLSGGVLECNLAPHKLVTIKSTTVVYNFILVVMHSIGCARIENNDYCHLKYQLSSVEIMCICYMSIIHA